MNRLLSPTLLLLVSAFAPSGCNGCGGGEVAALTPDVQFSSSLDFGVVLVGTRSTQVLVVRNRGNGRGTIRIESPGGAFTRLSPREVTIAAGTQTDVVLEVAPTTAGILQVDLVLTLEDAQRVRLTANAVAAPDCDDENDCTDETFDIDSRLCIYTQRVGECDDGNACSENDRCLVGVCIGDRFACDDGVDCTIDGCDVDVGCVTAPNDDLCDDGNACTHDVCSPAGCRAVPLPEGGRCGAGVECSVAEVCRDGVCTSVSLFDGAPCDDDDICTPSSACADGQCRPVVGAPLGPVAFERTFLQVPQIGTSPNRAAFAQGRMFVNARLGIDSVSITPDVYDVVQRDILGLFAFGVVRVDASTIAVDVRTLGGVASRTWFILDISDPENPTVVRTIPLLLSVWRVVPDGATGVGFCGSGDGRGWHYFADVRSNDDAVVRLDVECDHIVRVGDTLVVVSRTEVGLLRRALSFDGEELMPSAVAATSNPNILGEFGVQGRAVYLWREAAGPLMVDVIDPATLEMSRFQAPSNIDYPVGEFREELFVATVSGNLARFDVLDGSLRQEEIPTAAEHEPTKIVGASPDGPLLLLNTSANQDERTLRSFGVTSGGGFTPWRNGYSSSVERSFVGEDESLTIVGRGLLRGSVASLQALSAGAPRVAPGSENLTIVYDDGAFAGAFTPPIASLVGRCTDCTRRYHWPAVARIVDFSPTGFTEQEIIPEGLNEQEMALGFDAVSVRGARVATWSKMGLRLSLFDLAPNLPSRRPQRVASFSPVLQEDDVGIEQVLTLHANNRVTLAFHETAVLVDLSATPPVQLARDTLPNLGLTIYGHSYFSAWASAEQWLVLLSGGARNANTHAVTAVLRLTSFVGAEPVQVELPVANAMPTQEAYRAHILGVVEGLLYIAQTQAIETTTYNVLVYELDDLAAGPFEVVAVESEIVGMHVLQDSSLLVARTDGFSFVNQQCSE